MGVTFHLLSTDVFYFSKDLKMCYAFMKDRRYYRCFLGTGKNILFLTAEITIIGFYVGIYPTLHLGRPFFFYSIFKRHIFADYECFTFCFITAPVIVRIVFWIGKNKALFFYCYIIRFRNLSRKVK